MILIYHIISGENDIQPNSPLFDAVFQTGFPQCRQVCSRSVGQIQFFQIDISIHGSVSCFSDVYKVHRNLSSISDCVLFNIHSLLEREVSEFGRHLQHYFNLFYMYATLGYAEVNT